MTHVDLVSLAHLNIVPKVGAAKVGSLLQISQDDTTKPNPPVLPPAIALRSKMEVGNGVSQGLVLLDGDHVGTFVTGEEIDNLPALDVGDLAQIVIKAPSLCNVSVYKKISRGDVCQATVREESYIVMAISVAPRASVDGYVCLSGPNCGQIMPKISTKIILGRGAVALRDLATS
jgi:hypothetical protein